MLSRSRRFLPPRLRLLPQLFLLRWVAALATVEETPVPVKPQSVAQMTMVEALERQRVGLVQKLELDPQLGRFPSVVPKLVSVE